jgi:transposase-like protein
MKQPQQTHGTPETRRSFDDEFKRQAVALMETGRPVRHLAKELEVKARMLYEWKRKFGASVSSTTPAPTDLGSLQEESRSLKAEVARLRQREDILKKRSASSPNQDRALPSHRTGSRQPCFS